MLGVDDEVARRQARQLGQEGVGALAALLAADQPIAEHVLLGEDRDLRPGESMVERKDQQRRIGSCAKRLLPGADLLQAFKAMVLKQSGQPLARAGAVAREDDLPAVLPKLGGVLDDRLIDIDVLRPLRREIARTFDAKFDDGLAVGLGEGRGEVDWPALLGLLEEIGYRGWMTARRS